jgi:hypothetical protein
MTSTGDASESAGDPVEAALVAALTAATRTREWAVVKAIAEQLEARPPGTPQPTTTTGGVIDFEAERRRRT